MSRNIVAPVSLVFSLIVGSAAFASTVPFAGQTWDVTGTGATAVQSGTSVTLTKGAGDAALHLALDPSINTNNTPWVQFSYIDSGHNNIDMFVDSNLAGTDPRLQAGSLFSFQGLGYTRYTQVTPPIPAVENVEFAQGYMARANGDTHTIFAGKRADGTVDYVYDGMAFTSSFLKNAVGGAWGFGTDFLRLRGGSSGDSVTFTDFQFGSSYAVPAPVTPLPSAALGCFGLLGIFGFSNVLKQRKARLQPV
jgi:hypothetical protein